MTSMLIIHGDNIIASREFFLTQKNAFPRQNILEFSGLDISYSGFIQSISTPNLFGEFPAVFVEGLFSRRPGNEKKQIIDHLKNITGYPVFFYDSKDVSAQLKSIEPKFIKLFPLPKYLYSFLDTLSLKSLQDCFTDLAPELILASLGKHIHNLILVKETKGSFPPWQAGKLGRQSQSYNLSKLLDMQNQLLQIDFAAKTSQSSLDLKSALELWCLKNI